MRGKRGSDYPGFRKLHPGYIVALCVIISAFGAIAMQQTKSNIRAFLIAEAFRFIERVVSIPGIKRIALVGSLTREKADPKDADILVTVDDDADLTALATAARRLKGAAQTRNKGADIFLANPQGLYIGRICHWSRCEPGVRMACKARHCGKRHYLHDDLHVITLDSSLVKEPPVEVWPAVVCRERIPDDLMQYLSRFQSNTDVSS